MLSRLRKGTDKRKARCFREAATVWSGRISASATGSLTGFRLGFAVTAAGCDFGVDPFRGQFIQPMSLRVVP
jgi:hypothetical protein